MSARSALAETLQDALPNFFVLSQFGPIQATPAVIVARGPYKPAMVMGEFEGPQRWRLVTAVAANSPDSSDRLDDTVAAVLDVLAERTDLVGAVDSIAVLEVDEEELITVDGQLYLSSSIEVEVFA